VNILYFICLTFPFLFVYPPGTMPGEIEIVRRRYRRDAVQFPNRCAPKEYRRHNAGSESARCGVRHDKAPITLHTAQPVPPGFGQFVTISGRVPVNRAAIS